MGDNFYVVNSGSTDIFVEKYKSEENPTGFAIRVEEAGSFGELALMYDSPRAATVLAATDCNCWAIDRVTFKTVLMTATVRKRERYIKFLAKVPILEQLSDQERMTLADALQPKIYAEGDVIVREGDTDANHFYIVTNGECKGTKEDHDDEVCPRLKGGSYFGEIALLLDEPRAATITAVTKTRCLLLARDAFVRLLGPLKDILRRNFEMYMKYESDIDPKGAVKREFCM